MLKKIAVSQLIPGMYVADFNASWLKHPFTMNSKLMDDESDVSRVFAAGIKEVVIDTSRGLDVGSTAPTVREAEQATQRALNQMAESVRPAQPVRTSFAEETQKARQAFTEASRIIKGLMDDVRLGRQIELAQAKPTVEKITASVLRNSNALMAMRRLHTLDEYTFLHSVSVCGMLASFGKVVDMELSAIHDIALGGLIHDIGKMRVSMPLLNKPAKLTNDEFTHLKSHVVLGADLIRMTPGIPPLALEPLELHHERHNGSGYPRGLKGDEITRVGKMSAIVDVYDAITSDKVYSKGISPARAVQKLFEWAGQGLFDPELTQVFLKSIGIYPVGSLVRLESGRLGVVLAQAEDNLLTPLIRVMYDARRQHYIAPETIDLTRPMGAGGADRIVGYESPETFGIDLARFMA